MGSLLQLQFFAPVAGDFDVIILRDRYLAFFGFMISLKHRQRTVIGDDVVAFFGLHNIPPCYRMNGKCVKIQGIFLKSIEPNGV